MIKDVMQVHLVMNDEYRVVIAADVRNFREGAPTYDLDRRQAAEVLVQL